jgi:hypothetical protein
MIRQRACAPVDILCRREECPHFGPDPEGFPACVTPVSPTSPVTQRNRGRDRRSARPRPRRGSPSASRAWRVASGLRKATRVATDSVRVILCEGVEPSRGVTKITGADDVVAFEHGAGLMAGELHGHAFRHGGPHEVAHRGSPEVMRDPAGAAGCGAGSSPRFIEAAFRDAFAGFLARGVAEHVAHARLIWTAVGRLVVVRAAEVRSQSSVPPAVSSPPPTARKAHPRWPWTLTSRPRGADHGCGEQD